MSKRKITFVWIKSTKNTGNWEIRETLGLYAYRLRGWIGMEQSEWRITYYFGPDEPMWKAWYSYSNCLEAFDEAESCLIYNT